MRIRDFSLSFGCGATRVTPVRSLALSIAAGERVALVGESGCGKSLSALSLARLPPTDQAAITGSVRFDGRELRGLPLRQWRAVRGGGIAYVFQNPTDSLNPVMRVSKQIGEVLRALPRPERAARVLELLRQTGLPDIERMARSYPCELSGGQQQRVMLAMALASRPRLLVADEPTTALDVTTQHQVLGLIDSVVAARKMALLLITHNLGIVAGRANRVYVMYAGESVESGPVRTVLSSPLHPYTRGLLDAIPLLDGESGRPLRDIPGTVPMATAWPRGCAFAPRCAKAMERCHHEPPPVIKRAGHTVRCWLYGTQPGEEGDDREPEN